MYHVFHLWIDVFSPGMVCSCPLVWGFPVLFVGFFRPGMIRLCLVVGVSIPSLGVCVFFFRFFVRPPNEATAAACRRSGRRVCRRKQKYRNETKRNKTKSFNFGMENKRCVPAQNGDPANFVRGGRAGWRYSISCTAVGV